MGHVYKVVLESSLGSCVRTFWAWAFSLFFSLYASPRGGWLNLGQPLPGQVCVGCYLCVHHTLYPYTA